MNEHLPDIAVQSILAVIGILTVIRAFMQSISLKREWEEEKKVFTEFRKEIKESSVAQTKKLGLLDKRLTKHELDLPFLFQKHNDENELKFPSLDYVNDKFDNIAKVASIRYESLTSDQKEIKASLVKLEDILTDTRSKKLEKQDEELTIQRQEIAKLQRELSKHT